MKQQLFEVRDNFSFKKSLFSNYYSTLYHDYIYMGDKKTKKASKLTGNVKIELNHTISPVHILFQILIIIHTSSSKCVSHLKCIWKYVFYFNSIKYTSQSNINQLVSYLKWNALELYSIWDTISKQKPIIQFFTVIYTWMSIPHTMVNWPQ